MALSMAARYQDPSGPMFAAVVGHTGVVDVVDAYEGASTQDKLFFDTLFGGDPASIEFEYRRCSAIHLDLTSEWLPGGDHMALNLQALQTLVWYDTADPLASLVQQNAELFDWASVSAVPGFSLQEVTVGAHTWDTLDEVQTCDFLAQATLQTPLSGALLMDRNARFQHFLLTQDMAAQFSRLSYDLDLGTSTASLTDTLNVKSLAWDPVAAGFDTSPGQSLTVVLSAQDAADLIVLQGITQVPFDVMRDGLPTSAWSWSSTTGLLELLETDPAPHTWTISF